MNNKLREALKQIADICDGADTGVLPERMVIYNIAKAALSTPLRNYEVGTAEEQYGRHDKYCNSQPTCKKCLREDAASMCISCFAKWAQMPYAEGETDGGK